jgi:hypothetical protein
MPNPSQPTLAASAWPKPYLLEVYETALREGYARLDFKGDTGKAKSFIQAFYRLRRRSDAQHKHFVKDAYHLVSCTWEKERGTLLVTYSRLPDGHDLPEIQAVDPSELSRKFAEPSKPQQLQRAEPGLPVAHADDDPDTEFDVDSFMSELSSLADEKLKS